MSDGTWENRNLKWYHSGKGQKGLQRRKGTILYVPYILSVLSPLQQPHPLPETHQLSGNLPAFLPFSKASCLLRSSSPSPGPRVPGNRYSQKT